MPFLLPVYPKLDTSAWQKVPPLLRYSLTVTQVELAILSLSFFFFVFFLNHVVLLHLLWHLEVNEFGFLGLVLFDLNSLHNDWHMLNN